MILASGIGLDAKTRNHNNATVYEATAYSQAGITASGEYTHRHIVAADTDILPLGTRIKIKGAGVYSGEYVVADTGKRIQGRRLDIFIPSTAKARKFGKRPVEVTVIERGKGTSESAKQSDREVQADVARDLRDNGAENAATKDDLALKHGISDLAELNRPPHE
jgi:3D (Asp-Asp-Asp) domain-containing protein